MSILNYFFIGVAFTFLAEVAFNKFQHHPLFKKVSWGGSERIMCTLIWPLGLAWFLVAFFKSMFKN
tara:strand:+ start:313 stop:510 length:198 start_codon:yes stop_codon:yes gene_type:complete